MNEKKFAALVNRLEIEARKSPTAYKVRVVLLAVLGYLSLYGILAAALIFIAVTLYARGINVRSVEIVLIPTLIAVILIRSLRIKLDEKHGLELRYDHSPQLSDLIKTIAKAAHGPRLHKILLTSDFNAGIAQRGFGPLQKNYLMIGLPLLQSLTVDEFRSVLAHEFGHLSSNHGRLSNWIYRVRQSCEQVIANTQKHRYTILGFFDHFFSWYARYFNAYSFVIARAHEYEADRFEMSLVGRRVAAHSLIRMGILSELLTEEIWPRLLQETDRKVETPGRAFNSIMEILGTQLPTYKARLWFAHAISKTQEYEDTHPSLGERLEAIGYSKSDAEAELNALSSDESALSFFFGSVSQEMRESLDDQNRRWLEESGDGWTNRRKWVEEGFARIRALNDKSAAEGLTLEEKWELACYTFKLERPLEAIPIIRDVLKLSPEHAGANFMLGEALLSEGDEQGIRHLELAREMDSGYELLSYRLIYLHLSENRRESEAQEYLQRISTHFERLHLSNTEAEKIYKPGDFRAHGLEAETLRALRAKLATYPQLRSAYLVRRVVGHFSTQPPYVLGIISKSSVPWYTMTSRQIDQSMIIDLTGSLSFLGTTEVIALQQEHKTLRKEFKCIEGAQVYSAD